MDGNCKSTAKLEMEIRKKNAKFATKVKNSKWKLEKRTGNEQRKWKIGNGKWKFEKLDMEIPSRNRMAYVGHGTKEIFDKGF